MIRPFKSQQFKTLGCLVIVACTVVLSWELLPHKKNPLAVTKKKNLSTKNTTENIDFVIYLHLVTDDPGGFFL